MDPVTEDDRKLLQAFHSLTVQPKIETTEDLVAFMKVMGKDLDHGARGGPGATPKLPSSGSHHFPRISTFYGEDNKGEVSWPTFKFEVDALMSEKIFSEEQILLGIRRSVKGNASDILRRLGTGVSIYEMLEKLESTFGNIESVEVLLRHFYACQQDPHESVISYASRLEEIAARTVAVGGMRKEHDEILQKVFYQGLIPTIKQLAFSKCDIIKDYDRFKIEVRKIEADMVTPEKGQKQKCSAAVNIPTERKEKSELSEVKELLQKLNSRIDRLEQEKEERVSYQYDIGHGNRGGRGQRYRGYDRGRGRGEQFGRGRRGYMPSRQTGTNTMQPTCWQCNNKGHLARDCPNEFVPKW